MQDIRTFQVAAAHRRFFRRWCDRRPMVATMICIAAMLNFVSFVLLAHGARHKDTIFRVVAATVLLAVRPQVNDWWLPR